MKHVIEITEIHPDEQSTVWLFHCIRCNKKAKAWTKDFAERLCEADDCKHPPDHETTVPIAKPQG